MTTNSVPLRLGGVSEVAAELQVSRQQVAKLRQRNDFPSPVASLTVGEVWDLDVIHRWGSSGLRRAVGRPSASAERLAVGRRFEFGAEIGGGGFAVVHSAQDLNSPSGTQVAVKVLREVYALDSEIVARFERELRLMSELRDSNVMPVLASGIDEKHGLWYAMPIAGGSLADELGNNLEQDQIVAIMRQICAGLSYIHGKGILHRDLKPANVLRTKAGAWAIADFGLARAVAESSLRLTATAEEMGSAFYTAPEQWKDAKRVDERADIYSAGKILQALVVGDTPVDDEVPVGKLRAVILRAISHNRNRRYATAADLLAAIEAAVAVVPVGRWETSEEKSDRLWPRLRDGVADQAALEELIRWSDEMDPADYSEAGSFAVALSALPAESVEWWWDRDPGGFHRTFLAFTERLEGNFKFEVCDVLAGFARRAVAVTHDSVILQEAIQGLTLLGYNHNRWPVRDIVVAILQKIRSDEDAGAAIEGLRMAGMDAAEWTVGDTVIRTLRPALRAGVISFFADQPTSFSIRSKGD